MQIAHHGYHPSTNNILFKYEAKGALNKTWKQKWAFNYKIVPFGFDARECSGQRALSADVAIMMHFFRTSSLADLFLANEMN